VTEKTPSPASCSRQAPILVVTDLAGRLTVYVAELIWEDQARRAGRSRHRRRRTRAGKVTFIASQAEFTPKNVQKPATSGEPVYRVNRAGQRGRHVQTGHARRSPVLGRPPCPRLSSVLRVCEVVRGRARSRRSVVRRRAGRDVPD
jgi:hypothetical protein